MKKELEKMFGTIDEIMDKMSRLYSLDTIKMMSADDLEMIQAYIRLVDDSKATMQAEADQLDRIEKKLDELLSKEKES